MSEPLHATASPALTLGEIAALTGAELTSSADSAVLITGIAPLARAGRSDLVFIENAKHAADLAQTHAAGCLVTERDAHLVPPGVGILRVAEPYKAFVAAARKMFATTLQPSSLFGATGTSPEALVHADARLEVGVTIDPGAVIGPGAEIGSSTVIGANAVIGPGVRVGRDSAIGAGSSVMCALIGDGVVIHPGCHIGQDGFGYVRGQRGYTKIPQVGRVIIQDGVEIGAGTAIDRGAMGDTVIGEGTKIDNLVQIAHNVSIGRHCVFAAQVGIAGSATIHDHAVVGGQAGISDHVTIGTGAVVAAKSGVIGDVPAGERWGGYPARPLKEWHRATANMLRQSGRAKPRDRKGDEG